MPGMAGVSGQNREGSSGLGPLGQAPVGTEKTAMGGTGQTGFRKQCTDDPYADEPAICSFVHMEAVGRQGPPLSTQGPRLAILKYQGCDPTQPYPTFVVRQSATLLYGFAPQRKLRRCSALRTDG